MVGYSGWEQCLSTMAGTMSEVNDCGQWLRSMTGDNGWNINQGIVVSL